MQIPDLHIAATLGILLAAALLVGVFGELLRLPKVTAYLGVGILFGPAVLDIVPHEQIHELDPLLKFAMGLVLFQLGCQFPKARLLALKSRLVPLSIGELLLTFVVVAVSIWLASGEPAKGLLLGALALATAPATTLLVLRETKSEGPVTDLAGGLVAANNFASIVVFEVIFVGFQLLQGDLDRSVSLEFLYLVRDIGGSLALGALMGFVISFACALMKPARWIVLLVAVNALVLGFCETFKIPYMLSFLAMGFVVVNTSNLTRQIQSELNRLTSLLTVAFFVIHGAELNLAAFAQAGVIGAVYIIARCVGKYLGIFAAASFIKEPADVRNWLGAALLAQAGAAIALSAVAAQRNPEMGKEIQTIILGTVVFFELVGPVLIRQSVLRAGEVPVVEAVRHTSNTPIQQLGSVWDQMRRYVGRFFGRKTETTDLTVRQLMRSHVRPIQQAATFDDVLKFVETTHDDTYPVVDEKNVLIGIIRYRELSRALFDPAVSKLIRADDMVIGAQTVLNPEQSADDAMKAFRSTTDDCIPVVSAESPPEFLGIVRRRDVTRLLASQLA